MNRRETYKIILLIPLILFLCSCSSEIKKDRLVVGISSSLILGNNNPVFIQRNANVWEALTSLDDSLTPRPAIAESWNFENGGRKWTLSISKSKLFQNGDTLKPVHIVENIKRLKNHPELDFYAVYSFLDTVYSEGQNVILNFKKPCIDYPRKVGHYFAGIFHPSSFDENGKIKSVIATGKYCLSDYKIGRYELVKYNDKYEGNRPEFKEVEFRVISDPVIRLLALARGDIDLIAHQGGVQSYHLDFIKKYPDIKIDSFSLGITHYLLFNANSKIFSYKQNRRALNSILSRNEIVNKVLQNKGYPAYDYFVPTKNQWSGKRFELDRNNTEKFLPLSQNKKIRILLNQGDVSGWGFRLVAEYIANMLAKYSIKTEIKIVEGGAYRKVINKGEYDITLYPLSIPTGTPELFLKNLVSSKGISARSASNLTHIKNEWFDKMIESAVYAEDETEQQELYKKILDKLTDECLILPLFHEKYYLASKKNITGLNMDPFVKLDVSRLGWVK